jgi:hypothetical protein
LTEQFWLYFEAQVERTSTDSNFAIHKEKEMNFRRLFTAIALLALCVGLASAQISVGPIGTTTAGPLTCNATVASPPLLRSEGITDLIGDIVLTCTGGQVPAAGQPIPTANFTISLGTNVTSRLLGTNGAANSSEALLLIDEPGSLQTPVVSTYGPQAAQTPCMNAAMGCQQWAAVVDGVTVQSSSSSSATAPINVFQGLVNANQVTFNGVPILAPSTVNVTRVFRITNVRANINGLGTGGLPGTTPLLAFISISGSTALPINNPTQTAGFISKGLNTSLVSTTSSSKSLTPIAFQQCNSASKAAVATLSFSENFATAFKTRVAAPPSTTGSVPNAPQNVPGTVYNSESGFIAPYYTATSSFGASVEAGLADSGTRLKAVFNNLPAGVSIYVSTTNLDVATGTPVAPPLGQSTTSFGQLVVSETTPDTAGIPAVTPTGTVAGTGGTINVAQLPVVAGSATAVWEVVNSNPSSMESFNFGVYISYTANPGTNTPPVGTSTVNMSFAPTSTVTTASATAFIPRFVDTSTASNLFSVAICQTVLLYPFVTNQAGFDTGIAIANTTTDPFGTGPQAGTCTLNFYGAAAPAAAVTTDSIATGTVFTTLASTSAAGFQGYMIAVCNFQLAHGFAFISDLGARNLAMGYLALVLDTGTGTRNTPESLNQ